MKTRLFISLSVMALFGLSTTAYGTLYINGKDKDGNLPKSDCWEMKCPNGCVEEEGTLTGHCCPGGNSCRVDGKDISECCGERKTCMDGKCCVLLYYDTLIGRTSHREYFECCDNLTKPSGATLTGSLSAGRYTTLYGCCPQERTFGDVCCRENEKVLSTGCCPMDSVYIENNQEKCCIIDGIYGKAYANGTKCCKGEVRDNQCLCPEKNLNNEWDQYGCLKCIINSATNEAEFILDDSKQGKDCKNICHRCEKGECHHKTDYSVEMSGLCCSCSGHCSNTWCIPCKKDGECMAGYNHCSYHDNEFAGSFWGEGWCFGPSYQRKIKDFLNSK